MIEVKAELASDEWIGLAGAWLSEQLAARAEAVDGVRFSLCEVFTDPPAHLDDGTGKAAWWLAISGASVEVGRGDRTDLEHRAEVDYTTSLPHARRVYDLDMPMPPAIPAVLHEVLLGLHNYLAPRTA